LYRTTCCTGAGLRKDQKARLGQIDLRRQGHLAGFLVADQIAADRDERSAALGPERGDDVGRPRSPVEARNDRLLDLERVQ